jgi:hypothetical protein
LDRRVGQRWGAMAEDSGSGGSGSQVVGLAGTGQPFVLEGSSGPPQKDKGHSEW